MVPNYDPWAGAGAYTFDHATALKYVAFFEECLCFTNAKWLGMPFLLPPWEAAIIGNLFGWKRADGTRRYRKCLIYTAMKSGKTELAAGIGNALLFIDGEPSPEIVTAAGNADQATKIFNAASTMVTQEQELSRRALVLSRSIENTTNRGVMKVLNAAAKTKFGGNIHAALIDELHVHPDGDLVDVLERSMRARRQPLVLYTTTAGDNPESIAGEVYDYACKVRDGIIEDTEFLPIVYECPKDADITKPENWKLAQPNLGVTVPVAEYERDLREALAVPRKMNLFRQLQLNQWTESAVSWIGLEEWRACAGEVDPAKLKGKRATLGIDLSSTTDTTAIVAAIEDGDKVRVLPMIFIPRDSAEGRIKRQKRDRAPYLSWVQQGFITATEGNTIDYEAVEARIIELSKMFDVVEVQADPYNASGLLERLIKAGITVTTVRQGWSLGEATKETERMILAGELVHPDNPAFTWQVSNAAVKQNTAEQYWLDKQKSTRRIDAAVAMVMAVNALKFGKGREGADEGDNYYASNPLIVLEM